MCRAFEEGRVPRTQRGAILDHGRPETRHSRPDRLSESLLEQFRTGTSKHFGWLHGVLTRKTGRLESERCSAQYAGSDTARQHPLAETQANNARKPDLGKAARQGNPIICPLSRMVCALWHTSVVRLVKIHDLERDFALPQDKETRRPALSYKNGNTWHVSGEDFELRGTLVGNMAEHPPDAVPAVEERPTRAGEEDSVDNEEMLKCAWCEKTNTAHAWLRNHMLQKHPENKLSSGPKEAQEQPVSDGEAEKDEQEQKEFVCQQCHRVLESGRWLARHKCEPTSIINSDGSSVAAQSVKVTCPICSKEWHYRWLLRHMLM
ncbi:hypothetical protein, conserved, partial [Trypanosoma vivax Y486]